MRYRTGKVLEICALLVTSALVTSGAAPKTLNVVTTTEDMASLAREVGGSKVTVEALARGYQDPHFVDPKPSFLLKLQKADVLILVGLQLEIGWLPPLITQSRNPRVQPSASGYLDASNFAEILEIPTGEITRAMGDVHPLGNPHYWLDPENGRRVAKGIADRFAQLQREDAAYFMQRYEDFSRRLSQAEQQWDQQLGPFKGIEVVTYHNSWPNFARRFGLRVTGFVEPKPGIPPTPRHTLEVIDLMRQNKIRLILVEPYFDLKTPRAIAEQTESSVVQLLPSVGGTPAVTNYFQLFDYDIHLLTGALSGKK